MVQKKSHTTRDLIVSTALEQAATVGLEGISLGGIAAEVGMSKSGLFAHFKSKEGLQLAVLEAALVLFQAAVLKPALKNPQGLPRLRALYTHYLDWMAGSSGLATCPFTVFIQEYDARPGPVRDLLVKSEIQWRKTLSDVAEAAIRSGHLEDTISPAQLAFELIGAAFSFQVSHGLLAAEDARQQAARAFDRLVAAPRQTGH